MMDKAMKSSVKNESTGKLKSEENPSLKSGKLQCNYGYQKLCSIATSIQWWDCKMDEKGSVTDVYLKLIKIHTMHGALHPTANVVRLCLPRREGRRGLLGVEEVINTEERNINLYAS